MSNEFKKDKTAGTKPVPMTPLQEGLKPPAMTPVQQQPTPTPAPPAEPSKKK
jgi:hypothetical protein